MKYSIWMERFHAMEEHGFAAFLGDYEADSFPAACKLAAEVHPGYGKYDSKYNTIWGCRLFDNETDARKSFG